MIKRLSGMWLHFWLRRAGADRLGRLACRLAAPLVPPYKQGVPVARQALRGGYVDPAATVAHGDLQLGGKVFIGAGVTIFQSRGGGAVLLGEGVELYGDSTIETGEGGRVEIGAGSHIQPRCQFSAYKGAIRIGQRVEIAPNCAFYPYNHGMVDGKTVRELPLQSRGDIVLGDDVWLGFGVVVLDGVCIGDGAVVGAGAVVTRDVPAGAIAVGNPARVVRQRGAETPAAATAGGHA
jgi:acetyltransferase-like isoleucine patch superfamily enzyme